MTSKETHRQKFCFLSVFVYFILQTHGLLIFDIFLSEISADGFDPSPATQNAGSPRPDPPIGDASEPRTKTK